ncbi:MAG: hypothetical protein ACI8S7_001320, partial [Candidatus Krumholzibacteriia bacterium]
CHPSPNTIVTLLFHNSEGLVRSFSVVRSVWPIEVIKLLLV